MRPKPRSAFTKPCIPSSGSGTHSGIRWIYPLILWPVAYMSALLGHVYLVSAAFHSRHLTPLISTLSWSFLLDNFSLQLHSFFLPELPFRNLHLLHMAGRQHRSQLCGQLGPSWDTLSQKCECETPLHDSIGLCLAFNSYLKKRRLMVIGSQRCAVVGQPGILGRHRNKNCSWMTSNSPYLTHSKRIMEGVGHGWLSSVNSAAVESQSVYNWGVFMQCGRHLLCSPMSTGETRNGKHAFLSLPRKGCVYRFSTQKLKSGCF